MTSHAIPPATPARRRQPRTRQSRTRRGRTGLTMTGFTMVEMLTVIGIIVILMAILLPVVGKVRVQVQIAHTKQTMSQIQQAIEQYYAEYKQYPGPIPNNALAPNTTTPAINGVSGNVTSTENLTLALCGGLQNQSGIAYNPNDVANSLGPANLSPNPMMQTRHVAFINATPGQNVADLPWVMSGTSDTIIPEFLDKFPARFVNSQRPILYIRAQRGNPVANGTQVCGTDNTTTQYNYNSLLPYAINLDFKMNGATPVDQNNNPLSDATYYTSWNAYFQNPNMTNIPRGKDAYILFSAGPDNIFGTTDDIILP